MGKSHLSEEDIKLRYITPAIQNAGWDNKQIRMEYAFYSRAYYFTWKHYGKRKKEKC